MNDFVLLLLVLGVFTGACGITLGIAYLFSYLCAWAWNDDEKDAYLTAGYLVAIIFWLIIIILVAKGSR